MLCVFVTLVSLAVINDAQIVGDYSCTELDTTVSPAVFKFTAAATACVDRYPTACATLYGTAAVPRSNLRDTACYEVNAVFNAEVKAMAVASCAKHCGYCCLTSEYNCVNKLYPRVRCETVTAAQCLDPKWRQIIAEDCPSVCGFCLAGGCIDQAIECANDPSICRNVDMQAFVKVNCMRTCGYCPGVTSAASVTIPSAVSCVGAVDTNLNCASWAKNGFCTNTFYTVAQRKASCAKTCTNLC